MKNQKKLFLKITIVLLTILIFIGIVSGFRIIKPETTIQTDDALFYERKLNTLIIELEDSWEKKVAVLTHEIKEEIREYKENTDGFLDEMYSIRVQFGSIGRQIGEWFTKDKDKVENYLQALWEEKMFTEEDINHLVNNHIYQALEDFNHTTSKLMDDISVSAYADNAQKQDEFRLRLIKGLEEYMKFDCYSHETTRGMLKDSGRVIGSSIGSGFVVDIALSTTLGGTASSSGVMAGPATLGISIAVGFLIDWVLKEISQKKAREEIHTIIEELAENVAKKVEKFLSYGF